MKRESHVPLIVMPLGYMFFVPPVLSPFGLWLSARAFKARTADRRWAFLLILIFIVGSTASWILFLVETFWE